MNYIRTLNIDEPLARIEADGTVRYHQKDALGSIIALTDKSGAVRTQYNYTPFGETEIMGELSDNPFQYTGRENDETGLYYYRARYYSPELKRFISEDPIGLGGGINFYAYVGNNPVNWVDPLGLYSFQQFLQETTTYSGIVAAATALTPGGQGAALVFAGIAVGAKGLEISLYSQNPYIDTLRESVKMLLPVKKPYDIFTDQAIDTAVDKAKDYLNDQQKPCN